MKMFKCIDCGREMSEGNKSYHLMREHGLTKKEYSARHNIKYKTNLTYRYPKGNIPHNKKYSEPLTTATCHVCGNKFSVDTRWYHHRVSKGKIRFACPSVVNGKRSDCCKKLQAITIKEIRSTPESRAKTHEQLVKRWSDPAARARYGAKMKSKPAAWHTKRIAATLKTCLSGRQTKPERLVQEFVELNNLPFRYVGDGSFPVGPLFPDFVSTDATKRVILVQGCYWHGCAKCFPGSKSKGLAHNLCLDTYKSNGYDVVEIWEHEFESQDWQSKILSSSQ